jgi:PAS domain S-box-containing protein
VTTPPHDQPVDRPPADAAAEAALAGGQPSRPAAFPTPPLLSAAPGGSLPSWAWLPAPILLALIVAVHITGPSDPHESELAVLASNLIFLTVASILVAYFLGRAFLVSGSPGLLLLACGAIAWGGAGTLAVWVGGGDADIQVTIHNSCVWLSALCHLAGVLLSSRPKAILHSPALALPLGLGAILSAMGVTTFLGHTHTLPTFFVPEQGGTPIRQGVLGSALVMFAAAASALLVRRESRASAFGRWYGLALALVAIGLLGILVEPNVASAVGWAGRVAQFLSGVYMVVAAIAAARESRVLAVSLRAWLRQTAAEREAAREQLQRSNQRLNQILDSIEDDFYVLDRDWKFTFASRRFTSRVGKEPKDFLGRCIWEMFPKHLGTILEKSFRAAMEERETRRFEVAGRYTDAAYRMTAFPSAEGITVLGSEITEQKRTEAALRAQNAVLAGISRIFREALTCVSEEDLGRVCLDVAEEVTGSAFGLIAEISASTGLLDAIAVSDPGWEQCRMLDQSGHSGRLPAGLRITGLYGEVLRTGRSLATNDPSAHPASTGTPAGHPALRSFLGVPLVHGDRVIGMFGLGNREGGFGPLQVEAAEALAPAIVQAFASKRAEVGLRTANERLEEADRRKNEFLAVLSHELRNPLTPIRNCLYILERAAPGGDQAQRAKSVIDRQIDHLCELVDDLLDVTRITRNKIQLHTERLELNNRSVFERSGVQLELAGGPGPIHVGADRTRMAQMIGNLLQNAAKFSRPGGRARISAGVEDGWAVVRVADDGIGIGPEVLGKLFQPFMQAEQSLDRTQGGLGLGLALVKGLAELHGGTVSARSDGVGRGAEFVLRLPLDPGAPLAVGRPSGVPAARPRRVLLIEDGIDSAESLRELLELRGHEVAVAHDGPSGLGLARSFVPEIVLCDIGLPGMDGFEVARAFRRDQALARIPLVALSGYALPEDLQKAAEAGFERHVAKPPSIEMLDEVLSGMAQGRPPP